MPSRQQRQAGRQRRDAAAAGGGGGGRCRVAAGMSVQQQAPASMDQAVAMQQLLRAAGLSGREGMGVPDPGLGLWAQAAPGGQPWGAPAGAARPAAGGMPASSGSFPAGHPLAALSALAAAQGAAGAPAAAGAGGGVAGAAALAQLLGQGVGAAAPAAAAAALDPAAQLAAVMQQLQAPLPHMPAAAEGAVNVASVFSQLGLLYSWYASNRAAYLEQVQMMLQLADRDRLMAAAIRPMAAAAGGPVRPPALRALDKALEIIRGSQALEQHCRAPGAATTPNANVLGAAAGGGLAAAAAAAAADVAGTPASTSAAVQFGARGMPPAAAAGEGLGAGAAGDASSGGFAARVGAPFAAVPRAGQPPPSGPGAAAAAAAAAISAMLQQPAARAAGAEPGGSIGCHQAQPAAVNQAVAAAVAATHSTHLHSWHS
ncbi:hypothetical protein COO60DRAFT_14730 [Scenedesmus sp. NREL 46B-D3]|nr:hypothetical protein COO60DRAFT_14730 [Scenedesmus sp. NREL 46B-D3]